jgi:hypothetical protein
MLLTSEKFYEGQNYKHNKDAGGTEAISAGRAERRAGTAWCAPVSPGASRRGVVREGAGVSFVTRWQNTYFTGKLK